MNVVFRTNFIGKNEIGHFVERQCIYYEVYMFIMQFYSRLLKIKRDTSSIEKLSINTYSVIYLLLLTHSVFQP